MWEQVNNNFQRVAIFIHSLPPTYPLNRSRELREEGSDTEEEMWWWWWGANARTLGYFKICYEIVILYPLEFGICKSHIVHHSRPLNHEDGRSYVN
jgi:hypothetical protein